MSDKTEWLTLRVSPSEMEDLKVLASKDDRSLSAMVRLLIKEASTERKAP